MQQRKRKAKVLKLVTRRVEANADAVSTLEELLAEAKRGEIETVAVAYVRPNRACGHVFSEGYCAPLLGAISRLSWRLNKAVDDDAT